MEKTIGNYKLTTKDLVSYEDTVSQVFRMAREYYRDVLALLHLTPKEFFEYIKSKPYVKDPDGIEFVNRPKLSLALAGTGHPFDCDDRAVLSLAYFHALNERSKIFPDATYETRIVVVGRYRTPHHIYIEFREKGSEKWIPFDPTYPKNEYGKELFVPGFKKIFYDPYRK